MSGRLSQHRHLPPRALSQTQPNPRQFHCRTAGKRDLSRGQRARTKAEWTFTYARRTETNCGACLNSWNTYKSIRGSTRCHRHQFQQVRRPREWRRRRFQPLRGRQCWPRRDWRSGGSRTLPQPTTQQDAGVQHQPLGSKHQLHQHLRRINFIRRREGRGRLGGALHNLDRSPISKARRRGCFSSYSNLFKHTTATWIKPLLYSKQASPRSSYYAVIP